MAHRLTMHNEDGNVQLWKATPEQAIERLAAYEDMHDGIEEQLAVIEEKLEESQAEGVDASKNSQLLAQRVALKTTLGMFEIYGIRS